MPGEGAVMNCSANLPSRTMLLEARDLVLERLDVEIFQLALALRRVLLLADMREAPLQVVHQLGEFLELAPAPALRHAAEAAHALRHVGLEADPLLLAVVADVDAGRCLLRRPRGATALSISAAISPGVEGLAGLAARPAGRTACRCAAGCRHGWSGCGRGWRSSEKTPVRSALPEDGAP